MSQDFGWQYEMRGASAAAVDEIAEAFHRAYERAAPALGYTTREASCKPWAEVPDENKRVMRATVESLLADGIIARGTSASSREEKHGA